MISVIDDPDAARAWLQRTRETDEDDVPQAVLDRIAATFGEPLTPSQVVDRILGDVRRDGDDALHRYSALLEGVDRDDLLVDRDELERLAAEVPAEVRAGLEVAADRIRRFHEAQPKGSWMDWRDGEAVGQIVRPIQRVGLYAPGGGTPLPSSLLMAAVPARVAGVPEVVVCTPPRPDGTIAPVNALAALLVDAEAVYALGGAQAVGAMAYGTGTIRAVDKIGGPGSLFTVLALRKVFGRVGIVSLPGPTETLLIADDSTSPAWAAADLLAQAEHDVLASSVLITTSRDVADAVMAELAVQLPRLPRHEIAAAALEENGAVIVVGDLDQAVELADIYAPEHLCLLVRDPWALAHRVRAGGVFIGEHSSEALGDYVVGPSHIMPTNGTARFSSPVNVLDFLTITSVFAVGEDVAAELSGPALAVAESEGLGAHASALRHRLEARTRG